MIRCIIVEDEPLAVELLCDYISKVPFLALEACCDNASQAMKMLDEKDPELMFLDINMPDISGLQLLKGLQHPPSIIITTAHSIFAVEGFELNVDDYLLKPISFERFLKAVNRVKDSRKHLTPLAEESNDFLFVKTDYKMVRINIVDIKYFEGLKDYVKIITEAKTYITRQSLKLFMEKLPDRNFIRVHRSFIIGVRHINAITKNRVIIGTKYIPVSENYREAFFAMIGDNS
jgi:DNA-binding LytR/AlgR family response regulator